MPAGIEVSRDGSKVFATNPPRSFLQTPQDNEKLVTIFDNIGSKYPKGSYWCCSANAVEAPEGNPGSPMRWLAAAFTPSVDHTVTRIEVAAAYLKGTNNLTLSLAEDAGGVPGQVLKSWKIQNMPAFGSCCVVTVKRDKQGVGVIGGRQYWVTLTSQHSGVDTWAAWLSNDTDQTVAAPTAAYCSSDTGGFCPSNDEWAPTTSTPGLAFAVKGF
jgi:hypothetical protein